MDANNESNVLRLKKPGYKKYNPVYDKSGRREKYLILYKNSETFYARKTFKKEGIPPLFKSTGEVTLGKARTAAALMIQRHRNKHLGIPDDHVFGKEKITKTFGAVAKQMQEDPEILDSLRDSSKEQQARYVKFINECFEKIDIASITVDHWTDALKEWRRTLDRKSFLDYHKYFNKVMRYAYKKRLTPHLVVSANPDKRKDSTFYVFSDKQLRKMRDAARDLKTKGLSLKTEAQFSASYESMMRHNEILSLEKKRYNPKTGLITLRPQDVKTGSKTRKGRSFIANPNTRQLLNRVLTELPSDSPYIFPHRFNKNLPQGDNKNAWTAMRKAAGWKKSKGRWRWHDLRHTAITKALLEKKLDIQSVSEYCGTSVRTLQRIYLHSKAEHTKSVSNAITIEEE